MTINKIMPILAKWTGLPYKYKKSPMKIKKRRHRVLSVDLPAAIATAYFLLCAQATQAQVINFDVPGAAPGGADYVGLGAYPDSTNNTYWNSVALGGTTTADLLSDGATDSAITLTLPNLGTYGGNDYLGTATGPELLFTPFAYNESPYTMVLSNVPAGSYDLLIYGINGSDASLGNSTAFSVNGITNDTLQTTSTNNETFVLDAGYVQFSYIAPSNGTITINV